MRFDVKIDQRVLQVALERLGHMPIALVKAAAEAGNAAVTHAAKEMRMAITARYNIKSGDVRAQFKTSKASVRHGKHVAGLAATGRRVPLIQFMGGSKQPFSEMKNKPRVGARKKVLRSGALKTIPGAFVARMKSGHVGIYRRAASGSGYIESYRKSGGRRTRRLVVDRKFGKGRVARLPVYQLKSLSIPRMAAKILPGRRAELQRFFLRRFISNVRRAATGSRRR